jgi:glycosyltransferase involved in cell wall biosynthesis
VKQPVHILQIIDGLEIGGAEILLYDLTVRFISQGYRVTVCYSEAGPLEDDFRKLGISLTRLPWKRRVDPSLMRQYGKLIAQDPPQIVHTHLFKSDFNGRLAARLQGVPVVVSTLHSCSQWARNALQGLAYGLNARLADQIIAVSDEVHDFALKYMFLTPRRLTVIPNGVQVERFAENPALGMSVRRELNIAPHAPLLGMVASLTPVKGHHVFLQAAAQIRQVVEDARFLVAGDGPIKEALMRQAHELGLAEAVIFCGNRRDIPAIMSALDVLVFASTVEGLPIALLEGMAAGRPVVATTAGGIPSVVVDGQTGLLVPPNDAVSLAQACLRLIADSGLRRSMGQNGCARVKAQYSIETTAAKTMDLYQSLLERRGAA